MDRRTFASLLAGTIAASALPASLRAQSVIGNQRAFMAALAEKPWLLGYLGSPSIDLHGSVNIVSGQVPPDLRGYFLRNGPALHDIGPDRFAHWFDAPGMVQKFTFAGDGQIRHHGRLIDTYRNRTEAATGRIAFSAFGTHGHGLSSGGSADGQNPANISLLEHAGELLALWEGGSPHIIDPETLDTSGLKSWSAETKGLPFGAHPRRDRDGSIWNIGYSIDPAALILYHISSEGTLLKTHILPQQATPMIHDFMITDTRIVVVAPPYSTVGRAEGAFIDRFEWQGDAFTRILVIDKNDLSNVAIVEADPFWVFHFGNGYDIGASEIGFDFAHHDNPSFMTQDAFAVMDGSWDGKDSAAWRYVQARLDLSSGQLRMEKMPELGQVEFIRTDERENLEAHRYSLMLAQPSHTGAYGLNRILLMDRRTGTSMHFDVSGNEILEEHLIVPKPGKADEFWIIGTALDWKTARTILSVYDGLRLSDGPVLRAELDIALPLGLHGTFVATAEHT
ncbi:MAG: carotenoid oxygenase family protein [Rhodospirillales bacterium]|nr:carotenoid oxygenase family protein [Rhodospirillales bacterium]